MTFVVLFVLCLLGRPLLAIACDVHDATHHDVAELVQLTAIGEVPQDPDGESLLHDLLHVAHLTGFAVEMNTSALRVFIDVSNRTLLPELSDLLSDDNRRSLFRPPISV